MKRVSILIVTHPRGISIRNPTFVHGLLAFCGHNQAFCRILYIGVPSERDGDQREIYQVLILIK